MKRFVFFLLFALVMFCTGITSTSAESPWDQTDVDRDKDWTITFNNEVDETTINNDNIYVLNSSGNVVEGVKVSPLNHNKNSVTVEAPTKGYDDGSTYYLYIEQGVASVKGKQLKSPIKMKFTVKSGTSTSQDPNLEQSISSDENGDAIYYDGWVYYVTYVPDFGLFRKRLDGSEKQRLESGYIVDFIIDDGWIYYTPVGFYPKIFQGLSRVKLDGSENQSLYEQHISDYIVHNDWIYYTTREYPGVLFKMRTDGSNIQEIDTSEEIGDLQLVGNTLYYVKYTSESSNVIKVNLKEFEKENVLLDREDIYSMRKIGNTLYIIGDSGDTYQINNDSTEVEKVAPQYEFSNYNKWIEYGISSYRISYITAYDKWIYYGGFGYLFRMNGETGEEQIVYELPEEETTNENETISKQLSFSGDIKDDKMYAQLHTKHFVNDRIVDWGVEAVEMDLNGDNQRIISEQYKVMTMDDRYGFTLLDNKMFFKFNDDIYELK